MVTPDENESKRDEAKQKSTLSRTRISFLPNTSSQPPERLQSPARPAIHPTRMLSRAFLPPRALLPTARTPFTPKFHCSLRQTSRKKTSASQAAANRDKLLHAKGYRPGDNVVIFDGVCAMCNSGVDFVMRHDTRRQFKFAALQSDTGQALAEKFRCPTDLSTMVYVERNRAFVRSDAMLRIGARLGWAFALPAHLALLLVPKPARDFVYTDLIAKNRYEVFGKRDQCRFVEPGEEHRFLD